MFSSAHGDSFGGGRGGGASSDPSSDLWGRGWSLGSARRFHDSFDGSSARFPSLSVQFPRTLDQGYAPFDLVPATLRAPVSPPQPGEPAIRVGNRAPSLEKDVPGALWLCRAGAIWLHGALIALLVYEPVSTEYGGSRTQSSAISVNVTTTQVIDSIDEKANDHGAPMDVPLAQNIPDPEPVPEQTPEPPKPDENIVLASQNSDTPLLTPEPVKPPEEKKEEEKEKKVEQKAPKPLPQNVATSSGVAATTGSQGQVSASFGDVRNYNASVRAKIARHKPQGLENHGVTRVSFEISPGGDLVNCHVVDSSGNSHLDNAALRTIRNASPFSPPPGGRPLSFTIKFNFGLH